ncbi:MAG TPA: hypothetical protein IAC62_14565 [Candidatus Pelethocola excrementipullorum]|nr:hypothetical protein [Candidatus Pelethocola excrementipullorum]
MRKDTVKIAKQIAGTMAIEGMKLKKSEYDMLTRCASGEQSTSKTIKELITKYTVK